MEVDPNELRTAVKHPTPSDLVATSKDTATGQEITDTEAEPAKKDRNAPFEFTLEDGRKAVLRRGKGKHVVNASRMINGDRSLFLPAMMSQLCEIDGRFLPMEDFLELPDTDYMTLMTELGGNFM